MKLTNIDSGLRRGRVKQFRPAASKVDEENDRLFNEITTRNYTDSVAKLRCEIVIEGNNIWKTDFYLKGLKRLSLSRIYYPYISPNPCLKISSSNHRAGCSKRVSWRLISKVYLLQVYAQAESYIYMRTFCKRNESRFKLGKSVCLQL